MKNDNNVISVDFNNKRFSMQLVREDENPDNNELIEERFFATEDEMDDYLDSMEELKTGHKLHFFENGEYIGSEMPTSDIKTVGPNIFNDSAENIIFWLASREDPDIDGALNAIQGLANSLQGEQKENLEKKLADCRKIAAKIQKKGNG